MGPVASIVSPRDAALKGKGLRDRTEESLFELMRRRSIPGAHGFVYRPDDNELASPIFDGYSIPNILNSLIERNIALALPTFELNDGELGAQYSLYVRSGPPKVLEYLYSDCAKRNVVTVTRWMESIHNLPDRLEAEIFREYDETEVSDANPGLLRPLQIMRSVSSPLRPREEILLAFQEDLATALLKEDRVLRVSADVYFPLILAQLRECYEAADAFLEARLIPAILKTGKGRQTLRGKLKRLRKAEARYYADPVQTATGRFAKRRAAIVRRCLSDQAPPTPTPLAIMLIEVMAVRAEQAYRLAAKAIDEETVIEFRNSLFNHMGDWRKMYRCVDAAERQRIRPGAWASLRSHPDLFCMRYERPGSTQFIFVPKIRGILPALVTGMLKLKSGRRWEITALEELIHANKHFWASAFKDPEFEKTYDRLLRLAYRDYIPWYSRLLLMLGIHFMDDRLFEQAHSTLRKNQKRLTRINSKPRRDQTRFRPTPRRFRRQAASIDEVLKKVYYTEQRVPSIQGVADRLGVKDMRRFKRVLEEAGFRLLSTGEFAESALFFRKDANYAKRVRDLRPIVAGILADLAQASGTRSAEIERAKRLQIFLGAAPAASREPTTVDDRSEAASRKVQELRV